jgi:hypothetical protein
MAEQNGAPAREEAAPGPAVAANPEPAAAPGAALTISNSVSQMLIAPQVADQTSYAGVTYFDLGVPQGALVVQLSIDRSGNPITAATTPSAAYTGGTNTGLPSSAAATAPLAGSQVNPNLRVRSQAAIQPALPVTAINAPIVEPPEFSLIVDSPSSRQTINGPANGVTVQLSGTVILDPGDAVVTLTYSRDAGASTAIRPDPPSPDGTVDFSTSFNVTQSGTHDVKVHCETKHGKAGDTKISFSVNLSAGNRQPNPPTLTVTSPLDGTTVGVEPGNPGGTPFALVAFQGTAAPSNGATITSVTIVIDGDASTLVNAVPKAPGDWSEWSATQELRGIEPHQAIVSCTDSLGGFVTVPLKLTLALFEPRLWLYSKLMIVESLRLTSFLGNYGSGRVVRTMSLLPGESTTISVRSYSSDTTTTSQTSSIFDSVDDSSSSEFNDTVTAEQSDQTSAKDSLNWQVSATANASWGWGSATIQGGVQSSANSAREDASKTLNTSAQKHAATRSAKRNIQVNAETQHEATTGEDQTVTRTIKNINVSRTLNFVFRQMNQEYLTVQHLVDVRLGYVAAFLRLSDGTPFWLYQEATLPRMYDLINSVVQAPYVEHVYETVLSILQAVPDYLGVTHPVIETVTPRDINGNPGAPYVRFNRALRQTWSDGTYTTPEVEGVVINGTKVILRTDGVMVDSQLGQNSALHGYSEGLQQAALLEKQLANLEARQRIDIVKNPVAAEVDAWVRTHPCCLPATLSIAATNPPATAEWAAREVVPPAAGERSEGYEQNSRLNAGRRGRQHRKPLNLFGTRTSDDGCRAIVRQRDSRLRDRRCGRRS